MVDIESWMQWGREAVMPVMQWLQSPSFYVQIAVIVLCWILAKAVGIFLIRRVPIFSQEPGEGRFRLVAQWIYKLRKLLFPILLVLALAAAIPALQSSVNSAWLARIAQGLALVLLLYSAVNILVPHAGLRRIVNLVVLPSALLLVFGQFDAFSAFLDEIALEIGNIRLSALLLIKAAIFGAILFWLGRQSNSAGQTAIRKQKDLDLGMKELIAKLFQIVLFIGIGIVFLQILGVDLTTLAVLGGAVGVGLGFGLQQIAANFISGMIILFERLLTIGDYVEMEDGKAGILKEINMRSTTLETFDGKEVMVPNEKFITTTFVNWTRDDPRQRYEVEFQVAYDTDIEKVPEIINKAVTKHPQVLTDPEPVDTELRGFGDSGVNFAVEFWAEGIDDGKNRFSSDVLFLVWRALRDNDIQIPFPQREVRILEGQSKLAMARKGKAKG